MGRVRFGERSPPRGHHKISLLLTVLFARARNFLYLKFYSHKDDILNASYIISCVTRGELGA